MEDRNPDRERFERFNEMSDAELMHFRDTHNHQSSDRALAIRVLEERRQAIDRRDFKAVYDQGERGFGLNKKVLWWVRLAGAVAVAGALLAAASVWEGWK